MPAPTSMRKMIPNSTAKVKVMHEFSYRKKGKLSIGAKKLTNKETDKQTSNQTEIFCIL